MSDKTKALPPPTSKVLKTKRASSASVTSLSSRGKTTSTASREKSVISRPKVNKNSTLINEGDLTMCKQDSLMPDFDAEHRQVAYGKFLRAMLEDCLVDEKIDLEETQMDIQMAQLADRFQKTVDHLDKTNKRLKDISFVVEQKRFV